jgi:ATP synthase F0 subunit c
MEPVIFAKYFGAVLAMGLSAIGCGIGEGRVAGKASESIIRQPKAAGEVVRAMLVTQAVSETPGIFGLLIAFTLLFVVSSQGQASVVAAYVSAGFCMGAGAIGAGLGEGIAGGSSCESIARYPSQSENIVFSTLLGQAVSETCAIFALIISLLLCLNTPNTRDIGVIGALMGAGFSMGIGAIVIGAVNGWVTSRAVWGIGRNPRASVHILRTMFIGQAVTESLGIYSLVIALSLIFK